MSEEHKVIWLSPSCEDGERTWCSNDEWGECDECGAKPVKYVLAESVVIALQEACDLLAERKHGNPARSAGHNARLCMESALASLKSEQHP